MDLAQHGGFILGAYLFTAMVIGGLILHAILDNRAQRRALARMQDEGGSAGERP